MISARATIFAYLQRLVVNSTFVARLAKVVDSAIHGLVKLVEGAIGMLVVGVSRREG